MATLTETQIKTMRHDPFKTPGLHAMDATFSNPPNLPPDLAKILHQSFASSKKDLAPIREILLPPEFEFFCIVYRPLNSMKAMWAELRKNFFDDLHPAWFWFQLSTDPDPSIAYQYELLTPGKFDVIFYCPDTYVDRSLVTLVTP